MGRGRQRCVYVPLCDVGFDMNLGKISANYLETKFGCCGSFRTPVKAFFALDVGTH